MAIQISYKNGNGTGENINLGIFTCDTDTHVSLLISDDTPEIYEINTKSHFIEFSIGSGGNSLAFRSGQIIVRFEKV